MTEPRAGRRSQLVIWAVGEARRLRRQASGVEETRASPATTPTAESEVEPQVPAEVRGFIVDWQLSMDAAREASSSQSGGGRGALSA